MGGLPGVAVKWREGVLGQATWVLLQRGGGGVVHGIVEVDKPALGWPTYGHWPGRSTAAVGGRAVVVVV